MFQKLKNFAQNQQVRQRAKLEARTELNLDDDEVEQYQDVLDRISGIQSALADPTCPASEKTRLQGLLGGLTEHRKRLEDRAAHNIRVRKGMQNLERDVIKDHNEQVSSDRINRRIRDRRFRREDIDL